MDIDTLVMTAAVHHGVHAAGATTVTGPLAGSKLTSIEFPAGADARTFAAACMAEGIPALAVGATTLVLHT